MPGGVDRGETGSAEISRAGYEYGDRYGVRLRGRKQQALSLIHEVTSTAAAGFTSPYVLALTYATLGDRDNTIAQLQKSADHHEGQILYIKYDPSFDYVRADARFVALEKRVGLVP